MQDCIFCKIIKNEIPSEKIFEDELILAFLDINPVNLGHTLIIPKKHFENIFELPEETALHIMRITKKISTAIKKSGADGINISINNGKAAGQVIFHSHTHIIPRFINDGLPSWPARTPKEGELKEIAKKIIREL